MNRAGLIWHYSQRTVCTVLLALASLVMAGFALAQSLEPRARANLQALKSAQAMGKNSCQPA